MWTLSYLLIVISVIIDEFSMLKADMLYQLDFRLWWVNNLFVIIQIKWLIIYFYQWAEGKLVQTIWRRMCSHFWWPTATSANQGKIPMEWSIRREAQECSRIESPLESLPTNFIENKSQTRSRFRVFKSSWENQNWTSWRRRIWNIEETSIQERWQKYSINVCVSIFRKCTG